MSEPERYLQKELREDERILWTGKPMVWPLWGGSDIVWIPLGIMWFGLGLGPLSEILRSDLDFFAVIFFVFFFLGGLYLLTARFILKALARRRTYYAVTTRRVLVLRMFPRRSLGTTYIDSIVRITKEVDRRGRGTITLGDNPMWRAADDMEFLLPPLGPAAPALINIQDVERVYALIDSLRQEAAR